jgi:hypothetical protein
MITKKQAEEAVATTLRSRCQTPDDSFVIVENLTIEKPFGWVFFYDSKKYLETGNINDAIAGNGPIFVNKHTGRIEFCGSYKSVQEFVFEYERKWAAQDEV